MPARVAWLIAALLALALAACGDNERYSFDGLVDVSGDSPYPSGCTGAAQKGVAFTGFEVEPSLAIDPADGAHLVAAWQQDRWSNGGSHGTVTAASFDGGRTWTQARPALSHCGGGTYERASDPWVAIAADGTPYVVSIAFDGTTDRSAVLATRSHDGGRTWEPPVALVADDDPDIFNDKDAITADPRDPGRVYAVWDRLTGLLMPDKPVGTGPAMLARTSGGVWEPARPIYDPGMDAQTIGNVIAVLPDGTLIDVFDVIRMASTMMPTSDVAVVRSTDGGDTWSDAIEIAPITAIGVPHMRTGAGLPQIAADPASGAVYVAWEDATFSNGQRDAIAVSRSLDGGLTWSAPMRASGAPDVPAFTPQIAVAAGGTVGVVYYDLREAPRATAWLATSSDGGATWADDAVSGAFSLTPAKIGTAAFLGDYEGLVARGERFIPLVVIPFEKQDPTDIFVRP